MDDLVRGNFGPFALIRFGELRFGVEEEDVGVDLEGGEETTKSVERAMGTRRKRRTGELTKEILGGDAKDSAI